MEANRSPRRGLILWVVLAAAVAVVAVLLASGRLNARLLPVNAARPAPQEVQCLPTDGTQPAGWSADGESAPKGSRVDPVAVCDALAEDTAAVARMDQIATQQRALGHDCATFDATGGETWYLTGLTTSPNGTYSASGGPAPGRLPDFGVVSQPAPLVGIPRVVPVPAGCALLPTVHWDFSLPPLTACTSDGMTISVYERTAHATAQAVCAAHHLTVAQR